MESESEALVQLALDAQGCSQKELAGMLQVSPTQISKWKNGEYISFEMTRRLRALAKIGDKDPCFVLWAGSLENAEKWEKLILYLADEAIEEAATGYETVPLMDEDELLCWRTFSVLRDMGVTIPPQFPAELDPGDGNYDDDDEKLEVVLSLNPYSTLIHAIFLSLNDVYGFYAAYVSDLIDDEDLDLMETPVSNIYPALMDLAAAKIEPDHRIATRFSGFKHDTLNDFAGWLSLVKEEAFRAGHPLRAELMDMVYVSHERLGEEAERESLGFNSSRVHPDIYMNELLCGMRFIQKILPPIIKKLGLEDGVQDEVEPSEPEGDRVMSTVPLSPETIELLKRQKEEFVIQFGREPGPDDPVFFDRDADEPTSLQFTPTGMDELDFNGEPIHLLHATVGFDQMDRATVKRVTKAMGDALGFQVKPFKVLEDRATYKLERVGNTSVGQLVSALKLLRSTPPVSFVDLYCVHDERLYIFECDDPDEVRASFR
jgi:transcriptional regulator with XRE-family HTH domain